MMNSCHRTLIFLSIVIVSIPSISSGQIVTLSGFVYDESGAPVADADLDFDDAVTGRRIYTPNDNTDQSGFYRVTVIAGTYHISYAPPVNTHLLGKKFFNYALGQSEVLDVTLDNGVVISGVVRDSLGQPIPDIDFDIDSLGAGRVYTPNDASGLDGSYWLVTPPGNYRLRLSPPAGSRIRGVEIDSIAIDSDIVRDFNMPPGWILSGRVTDSDRQGQGSIQIGIRDRLTGAKIFAPNNETDSSGNYAIAVPSGTLTVRFTPPYGSRLVALEDSIDIVSDRTVDRILLNGIIVNLQVTDSSGSPISDVDFDFTDETTGIRAFTPYDKSDMSGQTIASLMPDTYTVRVDPPPGSLYDRLTFTGVPIQSDTSFAFILPEVQRVSFGGRVVDRLSNGIPGVVINLRSSITDIGVSLSGNVSDTLGFFDIAVPTGLFDVSFSPERGSRFAGYRYYDITFANDTLWSEVVLDTGAIFSALVMDPGGYPLSDVDFDFTLEASGELIFTPHDNTDDVGTADITMQPGTYTIALTPPAGSHLAGKMLSGVNIDSDTSASFLLTAEGENLPDDFKLRQNYPNPFNDVTSISYILLTGTDVKLNIYNAIGQRVRVIGRGHQSPGLHEIFWDGRDDYGEIAASGLYFYQLRTSSAAKTKKMLFVK